MNNTYKKRVLVTGAAGFIGSHLVGTLLKNDVVEIIAVDSLICGNWSNIRSNDNRLKIIEADFSKQPEDELLHIFKGVNTLFHLAAEKHNSSINSPERVREVNINGTEKLVKAALEVGVKKIIFTSSLYAYGKMNLPAMVETDTPEPRTVYGELKLIGEKIIKDQVEKNGAATYAIMRLFFTYGPRQLAGQGCKSVILANFERIISGQQPIIFGDGKQELDYVFVDDVVDALLKSAYLNKNIGPLNIGSGESVSVLQLTDEMLNIAKSNAKPMFAEADWTDGSARVGNSDLAKKTIDWVAKTNLQQGLREVYKWLTK